jgi:hypothetical protein
MNEKICAPSCQHCGEPMTFERMTPKSALIPELRTFVCSECGDIETIEVITVREGEDEPISNPQEELMDSQAYDNATTVVEALRARVDELRLSTSVASAEKSPDVPDVPDVEIGKVRPTIMTPDPQIERAYDIERISSSLARLTSSSMESLEGLTSELQDLQKFLRTEVARVQSEVDNAVAGIKIIMEAIAPLRSLQISGTASRTVSLRSCSKHKRRTPATAPLNAVIVSR